MTENFTKIKELLKKEIHEKQLEINEIEELILFLKDELNHLIYERTKFENLGNVYEMDSVNKLFYIDRTKILGGVETEKIPGKTADNFINEFKGNFNKKYHKVVTLYKSDIWKIINSKKDLNLFVGESKDGSFVFSIKNSDGDFIALPNGSDGSDYINHYKENLLTVLDQYISDNSGENYKLNTQRFTLSATFIDLFINGKYDCLYFHPAICTESGGHKSRLTFIIAPRNSQSGKINFAVYDRNGLCPPPPAGKDCYN